MQMRQNTKKPAVARQNMQLMSSFMRRWNRSANTLKTTPANAPAPTDQKPIRLASCWSKPNGPIMMSSADDHACAQRSPTQYSAFESKTEPNET